MNDNDMSDLIDLAREIYMKQNFYERILDKLSKDEQEFVEKLKSDRDEIELKNRNLQRELDHSRERNKRFEYLLGQIDQKVDLYRLGIYKGRRKDGVKAGTCY